MVRKKFNLGKNRIVENFERIDKAVGKSSAIIAIIIFYHIIIAIGSLTGENLPFFKINYELYLSSAGVFLTIITLFFIFLIDKKVDKIISESICKLSELKKNELKKYNKLNFISKTLYILKKGNPKKIDQQIGFIEINKKFKTSIISLLFSICSIIIIQSNNPVLSLLYIIPFWKGVESSFYLFFSWYYYIIPEYLSR